MGFHLPQIGPTIPTSIENGPTNLSIQRLSDYPNGIQIIVMLHDKQITLQAKRSHIPDFGKGTFIIFKSAGW